MAVKDFTNLAQSMQALAIANDSYSLAKKKKAKTKDFLKTGINSTVGITLLKEQGKLTSGL